MCTLAEGGRGGGRSGGITQPGQVILPSISKALPSVSPLPTLTNRSILFLLLFPHHPRHPSGGVCLQSCFGEKKEGWSQEREREREGRREGTRGTQLKGRTRQQQTRGGGGEASPVWLNTESREKNDVIKMDEEKSLGSERRSLSVNR